MQEPSYYEHKKWVCDNVIAGIIIETELDADYQTHSYWKLLPWVSPTKTGKPHRIPANVGFTILDVGPDWQSVAEVKDGVREEVEEYQKFCKKNARELAEYKRLKAKFG